MVKVIEQVGAIKRKRYNKNKKKAWRKKVDLKDVEEKLEELRREERYGGPLEEREDKELMFLDLGDDSEGKPVEPVTYSVDTRPGNFDDFKSSSRKRPVKNLRCHQYLKGFQGAKTPHKAKTNEDRVNAIVKRMKNKSEVEAKKKNLAEIAQRNLKQFDAVKEPKLPKINNKMMLEWKADAWDANSNELVKRCKENGVEEEFVDQIVDYHSTITKTRQFNVPGCRYKQTSALPSVKVPEPGQSYNPAYEDHQILLEKAVRQELKRRSVAAKYTRATTKMFPTIDKAPTEQTWLAEMSEGLPKAEENDDEEESEDENKGPEIEATVTGKRTTERKTKQQRKKEVKRKFKERRKQLAKERRIRESNVFRIKTYKKEIKESDNLLKNRQAARKAYFEQKKSKPLRLGRVKYEAEDIAVSLGDELRGSLRKAKPVVSLIDERFKNMQRRNLIEPRLVVKHKKARGQKRVMKKDHKVTLAKIEEMAADM